MGRHKRYANIDGTGEITFGLMALGFAFVDFVQTALPNDSICRHGLPSMALFFAIMLLMLGAMHWVPKAIKKRITWPRTGYVAYRVGGRAFWITMAATAVVSAIIAAGLGYLTRAPHPAATPHLVEASGERQDWMSVAWMASTAIYVAGYAWFTHLCGRNHPWKWLVLCFMVLGLLMIVLLAPVELARLRRPMLLFVGLMWMASGLGTLCSYIRHTQVPQGEE